MLEHALHEPQDDTAQSLGQQLCVHERVCRVAGNTELQYGWVAYRTCLILCTSSAFVIVWGTRTPLAPRIHLNNEFKNHGTLCNEDYMVGGRIQAGFDLASENG